MYMILIGKSTNSMKNGQKMSYDDLVSQWFIMACRRLSDLPTFSIKPKNEA